PKLRFDRARVHATLVAEVATYSALAAWQSSLARTPLDLLSRALEEKRLLSLEQVFLILALRYRPKDIQDAYQGLLSREARVRASAIEFLDNVLRRGHKTLVLPLLDPRAKDAARGGADADALLRVISGADAWLRSCGVFRVLEDRALELLPAVE